jgi:PTH2 family peptidyl-tRNA hydrolase
MSEMKQVIVIRRDLKLSAGKAVAQGGHACLGAYRDAMVRWGPIGPDMVESWDECPKKVCLAVDTEEELLVLIKQCNDANIGHYLVRDAGKTEVAPLTPTALGIGPDLGRAVDKITGELELY